MPDRGVHPGQPALNDVLRELHELEARVARIEGRLAPALAEARPEAAGELPAVAPAKVDDEIQSQVRAIPVFGRALLAIAGAYFLRALTEMGTLGLTTGVALGIAYAVAWLALAARTPVERRLEISVRSATAVLVVVPLIWEATVRFRALSTWVAAAVLALFTIVGLVVSWRKNAAVIAWITLLAGIFTAWALLMATRDPVPFTFALLAMAAAVEVSACLEHWLRERWAAAGGANPAVLLIAYLSSLAILPSSYAAIPKASVPMAQIGLLGIYLTSTIVRTIFRGFPFTSFETTQFAAVFLIGVGGGMMWAGGSSGRPVVMPAFTVLCGAACYVVSFAFLDRHGKEKRNFYTYATFGLLLTLAGSWMLLSAAMAAVAWSLLALVCVLVGGVRDWLTLRWHGTLYLSLATLSSGIAVQTGAMLLSTATGVGQVLPVGWVTALAVLLCFGAAVRLRSDIRGATAHFGFLLAVSALLTWHCAGLAAGGLAALLNTAAGPEIQSAYSATARMGVITLGSLALAWSGSRFARAELSALVFPMMLLGAYKLVAQDFRAERTMALFLSLLLYGGALTMLPRLLKSRKTVKATQAISAVRGWSRRP